MIHVRWEFEGTGHQVLAAQTVVDRILSRFQRALHGVTCPIHAAGAVLVVRGSTIEDLDLGIEPCCQALVDEANAQIHRGRRRRGGTVISLERNTRFSGQERRRAARRRTRLGQEGRRIS